MIFIIFFILNLSYIFSQPSDFFINDILVSYKCENSIPNNWLNQNIKITEITDKNLREKHKKILINAISKYPQELLYKYLKKIYIFKRFTVNNINYGGTYYKDTIYLIDNCEENNNYDEFWIEKIFHHELSSLFLINNLENNNLINTFISTGKKYYSEDGYSYLQNNSVSILLNTETIKYGFINEYGMTSFEEDFNLIASEIFKASNNFWFYYKKYPLLYKKTKAVIDFYNSLHPIFNERYFKIISSQ